MFTHRDMDVLIKGSEFKTYVPYNEHWIAIVNIRQLIDKDIIHNSPYNRTLIDEQISKIVDNFDITLIGNIRVAKIGEKDHFYIVDGQHRYHALKKCINKIAYNSTVLLEIIPMVNEYEFERYLREINTNIQFSEKDYDMIEKYLELTTAMSKTFLPMFNYSVRINNLFSSTKRRPHISETEFSKIKTLSIFKEKNVSEIVEALIEINKELEEELATNGYFKKKDGAKYKNCGVYLGLNDEWLDKLQNKLQEKQLV